MEAAEAADEKKDKDKIASEGGWSRQAALEFELVQRGGGGVRETTLDGSEESEDTSRMKQELHLPLGLATEYQAASRQPLPHSCDCVSSPTGRNPPDRSAAAVVTNASGQNPAPPSLAPPLSAVQPSLNTMTTTTEVGEGDEEQKVAPGDKNGGAVTV